MKRLILLMFALILSINISHAAEKRILIEQFTGAWCGWCVDGTYMLDSLIQKYPNQVIAVRQHVSDGMSTFQSEQLYNVFGAWGVPTATINRLDFTGKVGAEENSYLINRGYWFSYVQDLLKEAPEANVMCSWYFDEVANKIKGLVTSSLLKDLTYQQTLNAVVIENNITGTGKLFDQNNYYSGLQGAEKHPYYKKPAVLVGYKHNAVARYSIGGLWGEKLNIKKPGYVGESYQWSFAIDVPEAPYGNPVNVANLDIIGFSAIDETNLSNILNSAKGVKEIPKTTFLYSTNGATHFVNDKITINMKIENLTDIDNDYNVVIENQGYGAKDWLINVEKNAFSIKSGESSSFNIDITPNSQGMRKIRVILKDKDNKTFYAFSEITIYNTNTEKLAILIPSSVQFLNLNELDNANYNDFIWLTNDQYYKFKSQLPNIKLIIMDNSFNIYLTNYSVDVIDEITKEGKNLFVMGNIIGKEVKNNPKLLSLFADMGFKFKEQYTNFDNTESKTLDISGYSGDPVSDNSKLTLMPSEYRDDYSTFDFYNYDKARAVYSITKDPKAVIAFRSILNNQRVLIAGFNCFNIKDEIQRRTYIEKSLDWLMDGLGEDQAHLSSSVKELNFKLVELGKSDTMEVFIKNTGTTLLQLVEQNVVSSTSEYFALEPSEYRSINVGDSAVFQIRFTPLTKNQSKGYFFIKSNDPYRDSMAISLTGKGRASAMEDDLLVHSSIKTSPNPISNSAVITVIFENNMQNVTINLIDIEGRFIKQISNGDYLKGEYTLDLLTNDLNSGSYFIQLTNDISTMCQPIIIDK